jgi:microcystin-dependent protein
MKRFLFIITVCMSAIYVQAQVGINQPNPHPSTALEINGDGKKGLLIPFMGYSDREGVKTAAHLAANGLLVYDAGEKMFYYFNGIEWVALNPLQSVNNENSVFLSSGRDTIVFNNRIKVANIVGTTIIDGNTKINSSLNVTETVDADSLHTNKGIRVKNATVSEVVTAGEFVGHGTIPLGGIIMWNGTSVPDGWVLCNGGNGTPDLRGRFIVGTGQSTATDLRETVNPSYSIGDKGGYNRYALLTNEMPSHNHTALYGRGVRHNDSGENYTPISGFDKGNVTQISTAARSQRDGDGGQTNDTGSGYAHENRPPYYALAFIMRVK